MERFYVYHPAPKGIPKVDKVEIFMSFFIPGKENAIKRDDLIQKCVEAGLIGNDVVDKDRAMRNILKKAKLDYSITNDGDGKGYYIPSKKDRRNLDKNNKREDKKAISTFKGNKVNKAIAEDYRVGRL